MVVHPPSVVCHRQFELGALNHCRSARRPSTIDVAGPYSRREPYHGTSEYLIVGVDAGRQLGRGRRVRFNRDVRPILSNRCWTCHGPDEANRQADLRLDVRDAALLTRATGRRSYQATRKQLADSSASATHDEDQRMPPPEHGPPLSADRNRHAPALDRTRRHTTRDIGPFCRSPIPRRRHSPGRNGPESASITLSLSGGERGLRAFGGSRQADALAPRLSRPDRPAADAEEAGAFERDARPTPMNRRRSAARSPHYGERWGRHWLDLARYADTNGYTIDAPRGHVAVSRLGHPRPQRRHAVRSVHDRATGGRPAAGGRPRDQRIATGFHRNTLINEEGGVDPEQFRVEAVIDRVNTTGHGLARADGRLRQCHAHKYDPISHREYYQLFAFFNSCADINNVGPTVEVHEGEVFMGPERAADREELNAAVSRVERLIAERGVRQAAWEGAWPAKRR